MTTTFSYAKAMQNFDLVLKRAFRDGKAKIRKDGQVFLIIPESKETSPLDVEGVDMNVTVKDIISSIYESRRF